MRVIMVSTDRKIFEPGSPVAKRIMALGALLENLHIIIFSKKEHGHSAMKLGAHITVYPTNSTSKWHYIRDAVTLAHLAGKVDVVTAQDPFETGLAALRIAREAKAPLQLQIHTDFTSRAFRRESLLNRIRVMIARYTIPRATCVRAVSSRVVSSIEPLTAGHATRPAIVPVFTDVGNVIAAQPANLAVAHPEYTFFVATVSRLTNEKRVSLALEAVADLAKEYPHIALVVVGDGPEKSQLEKKARSLGIGKRTFFLGWMNEPYGVLKGSSVFLNTSDYEGYGMSLVEAAAAHAPIVTTDVGLVGDLLKKDIHCLVCPVGDAQCLADQMTKFIRDNQLRERIALAASEAVRALSEKTVDQYALEIKQTLQSCIATEQK